MVYSVRSNRTFCSTKPIKTKRVRSEWSKKLDEFMDTHTISVQTDPSGKVVVTANKIEKDE